MVDAKTIAVLHKQVFGEISFTTRFSIFLLTKFFEKLIEQMKYSIIMKENEEIVGYLFAGTSINQIISSFKKENIIKIIFCLLQNPHFIPEKIVGLLNLFKPKNKQTSNELSLYLIAVDNRLGKGGFGKELLNYFEELIKGDNEKSYTLAVRKNNQRAIDFYKKTNLIQIGENDKSFIFRKELLF